MHLFSLGVQGSADIQMGGILNVKNNSSSLVQPPAHGPVQTPSPPLTAPHLNINGEKPQGLIASGRLVWVECRINAALLWSVNHRFPFPVALAWPLHPHTCTQLCIGAHVDTHTGSLTRGSFSDQSGASLFCSCVNKDMALQRNMSNVWKSTKQRSFLMARLN